MKPENEASTVNPLTDFYHQMQDKITLWLSSDQTYYQLIFIIIALLSAYMLAKNIMRFLLRIQSGKKTQKINKYINIKHLNQLVYPFLSILLISIGVALAEQLLEQTFIIETVQNILIIWLIWTVITTFITSTLIRFAGTWILLPAALLELFGLLDPLVRYLDQYSFTIDNIRLSLYTLVKAVLWICIVIWLGKLVSENTEKFIRSNRSISGASRELLIKLFDILLYAALFLVTLKMIGIDLTAIAVFSGALGVGLGFGLQKIASNFISGIILLTEKSINIDNLIEMDDGVVGYIRKLGARASIIETFDGKEVMVPNEDFITSRVANLTHNNTRGRVEVPIGVSYGTDLRKAYQLILEAANGFDFVVQKDGLEPQCFLREYGDSSVNFVLLFWLEDVTKGRWKPQSDMMFAIWDAFKAHNIEIPFPQRDLHIKSGLEQFTLKNQKPSDYR